MISEKYIKKYKEIYKSKNDGKELSDQEALGQFMKLTTLVKAVYKPIPKKRTEKQVLIYEEAENINSEESKRRLSQAYEIIFEETLKRQNENKK